MAYRIFLVEDHPVVREAYASVLEGHGAFELCGTAESAEDALGVLTSRCEAFCDVVVTDVRLPGESGIDLVGHLRKRCPDLPVVVITGHEESVFERQALDAGAAGFLPKSRAARDLVSTILAVVRPDPAADGDA